MRLRIVCDLTRQLACPVNHQHFLTGLVYRLLECSDADYARFLHEEGYGLDAEARRFKLFTFSGLRAQKRRIAGSTLWLGPGIVSWFVASPVEDFLTHIATGLLSAGVLNVGPLELPITQIETQAVPEFSAGIAHFTYLSPIVAAVPVEVNGKPGTRYLRPTEDGPAFSEAVRKNLVRKYQTLHEGQPPANANDFELTFSADYLAAHRGGMKNIEFKGIQIIGAQAPFRAVGSAELLQTMWECGAGEKNSSGFGMVEVDGRAPQ